MQKYNCDLCNSEFSDYPSNRNKKHVYCSKNCVNKSKIGHIPWNKGFGEYIKNEKNPAWKGNLVGYTALHDWVKKRLGKPSICSVCFNDYKIEWANKSRSYERNLQDWVALCRICHAIFDSGKFWGSSTKIWNKDRNHYRERIITV